MVVQLNALPEALLVLDETIESWIKYMLDQRANIHTYETHQYNGSY